MSRKAAFCSILSVLAGCTSLIVPASAQHFKQVKGSLTSVSAGRNEVFGIDVDANVWRYSASSKSFSKIPKVSLTHIAVGGGTLSQNDEVWGFNANFVYRFNYSKKEFVQIPGILTQMTVGVGNQDDCHPYEVWGVNSGDEIFRFNYCENEWVQVSGFLIQVATGGGDVWGINSAGQIFHFNFAAQSWGQVSGFLTQIAVGVNDTWGLNGAGELYRYDPKTGVFNLVAATVGEVSAGGDGIWVIAGSDDIFRFAHRAGKNLSRSQAVSRVLPPDPEPASLELIPPTKSSHLFVRRRCDSQRPGCHSQERATCPPGRHPVTASAVRRRCFSVAYGKIEVDQEFAAREVERAGKHLMRMLSSANVSRAFRNIDLHSGEKVSVPHREVGSELILYCRRFSMVAEPGLTPQSEP